MTDTPGWMTLLAGLPTSVALALIFYRILNTSLRYHVQAMHEQRQDLLKHMHDTCKRLPPLLLLAALLLTGCTAATFQHGTERIAIVKFGLDTQIGTLDARTSFGDELRLSGYQDQAHVAELLNLVATLARANPIQPAPPMAPLPPAPATRPTHP